MINCKSDPYKCVFNDMAKKVKLLLLNKLRFRKTQFNNEISNQYDDKEKRHHVFVNFENNFLACNYTVDDSSQSRNVI